jgi:hypothetical protein
MFSLATQESEYEDRLPVDTDDDDGDDDTECIFCCVFSTQYICGEQWSQYTECKSGVTVTATVTRRMSL